MAAPTGAYQRLNITHELEDIRDVVDDVSPWLTPVYANSPKGSADNTKYEWHTDELDPPADPSVADGNAWIDGNTFAGQTITPPVRLNNECQIQRKDIVITRRARRINKAGQRDELARQVTRKGLELRRDCEITILYNQAKRPDPDGNTAPLLAGLPTYITGAARADRGATGADPTGDGSDAKTDGNVRALSEAGLRGVVQGIYDESQEVPNVLLLDTKSKTNFSEYMFGSSARIATQYQDQGRNPRGGVTAVGAVDVWVTDFAILDVVPDRFNPSRAAGTGYDAFVYNTDYVACYAFDPISTDVMAKTADTDDRMIIHDHTLVPLNPKTVGTFADIDESLAMVA